MAGEFEKAHHPRSARLIQSPRMPEEPQNDNAGAVIGRDAWINRIK